MTREEVAEWVGMAERRPWLWGRLTTFFLHRHIAREIRPFSESHGYSREEAIEVSVARLREHFDAAWPKTAETR